MKALKATIALGLVLAALPIASASAEVKWQVKARWGPTTLVRGDKAKFELMVANVGTAASSGTITVVDRLPKGVQATGFEFNGMSPAPWNCFGAVVVTCQASLSVEPRGPNELASGYLGSRILIDVEVKASATGGTNTAEVRSEGAVQASGDPCGVLGKDTIPCATDVDQIAVTDVGTESFGVEPDSYLGGTFRAHIPSMVEEEQAGTHPFEMRTDFDFKLKLVDYSGTHGTYTYTEPIGRARTVDVTLSRGISGNPEAVPKCEADDFLALGPFHSATGCPTNTQVGFLDLETRMPPTSNGFGISGPLSTRRVPIYNLEPPRGVPADLGFRIYAYNGHIYPSLDPGRKYAIRAQSPYVPTIAAVGSVKATIWGVPADPRHDLFRIDPSPEPGRPFYGTKSTAPVRPFLTMPSDCGEENGPFQIRTDAWSAPESFTPQIAGASSTNVTGCDDPRFRFEPEVDLQPTSRAAGGPTGLTVSLKVPQRDNTVKDVDELYAQNGDVNGIDTPPIKKAVVTMPEGMTLSTSAAQGLSNCSPEQVGIGTNSPVTCPESSRYGSLTLHTPILPQDEPMQGDIFVAEQNRNPFGNFLTLYFVIHDESRGLLVKLPGRIDLDPRTGQVTTTFDDLPQFPVSNFELALKGGVRAGLVNPTTCGQKQIKAEFFSWHEPDVPVVETSSYEITQKPNGSPCVNSLAERPFSPELSAGTVNPNAGSYSTFAFRLQRTDDDQEFSQLSTTLPPGLLANISEVSECPDAGIAQAEAPGRKGNTEKLFPSCPASSLLGSTDVGSGVGQVITYIPGKAYLAGPYKGEPLSLAVITPVTAGPYDLGVIAVRSAIHVNAELGQATVKSDPFPQVYEGIPVRLRDIRVKTDRPNTTINPTSCEPMAVTARVTGTGGNLESTADDTAADLQNRFQAANCASLGFKPKLSFKLKGATKRGGFPALSALLRARPGDANVARTQVLLPKSTFIAQQHIDTVCTRVQFAARACPAGSIYGKAEALSPLFDEVLKGPVYLRSNGGERLLPDLVISLNGKIEVVLAGFVDAVKERVRNTFDVIPDAPVTYFALQMMGAKKGLLENNKNLCRSPSRANVRMSAQNGKQHNFRSTLKATGCKAKGQRSGPKR